MAFADYATKFLYDHSGYDKVILVEDDLAREVIRRIMIEERLMENKLVHVLPAGGYTNVLALASDVTKNNLLGHRVSLCVILDGDVKEQATKLINKLNIGRSISVGFLPFESLEKYLRHNLFVNVDHSLFRFLNNYLFHQVSLEDIIETYKTNSNYHHETDNDGKALFKLIDEELRQRNKTRGDLIEMVMDYIFKNPNQNLYDVISFLRKEMVD